MVAAFSTSVAGVDFPLWLDEPAESWAWDRGRTRAVVIDDQFSSRQRFFGVAEAAAPTANEQLLKKWLNVELEFFAPPDGHQRGSSSLAPSGSYSDEWFRDSIRKLLANPRPIAAIFLDLLFGDQESGIENASGRRFLELIRRESELADVPVLILSNMAKSQEVRATLKGGSGIDGERFASFEDYLVKSDPTRPEQKLIERMAHKLVEWGDLADVSLAAFSKPMRRVARELRQIALYDQQINYEGRNAGSYPKPVNFIGEYGSGKNYLAQCLIDMSRRRANPRFEVTFTSTDRDTVLTTLYGHIPYSDGAEHIYTDIRTGAVVHRTSKKGRDTKPNELVLGTVGYLQQADMGDHPRSDNHDPLKGTVILDEIGASAQEIQRSMLSVLNKGQITPRAAGRDFPTERRLDVWFLVPSTPRAFDEMSPDLRSRLTRGHTVHVPPLSHRQEDVVALALNVLRVGNHLPLEDTFKPAAIRWLIDESRNLHVRDLHGLLEKLSGISGTMPYNAADLKNARAADLKNARALVAPISQIIPTTTPGSPVRPSALALGTETTIALPGGVPHQIGTYTVVRELGRGAAGVVYLARQAKPERDVALKLLTNPTEETIRRFHAEANAVAALDHPNIVPIFEVGEHDGSLFYSMRYVDGQSLASIAVDGPVKHRRAAEFIRKIAEGIHYCHGRGIIHRDIKPANILIDSDDRPWITDFGMAAGVSGGTQDCDGLFATPSYCSPEQAWWRQPDGKKAIGPATDIYSLGASLYRLLVCRPPFAAADWNETLRQVRENRPVSPRHLDPSIPPELEAICLRCLAKDPVDRYPSAQELADALKRYLDQEPDSGHPRDLLDDLTAAAARDALAAVERAIPAEALSSGQFSVVSLYRALTGRDDAPEANTCRSRLARLLLLNETYSADAIRSSPRLKLFAADVGKRNAEVKKLFDTSTDSA